MFALPVVVAVAAVLAWLKVRYAPSPVYDWPVWAYRAWLAALALVRRARVSGTAPR